MNKKKLFICFAGILLLAVLSVGATVFLIFGKKDIEGIDHYTVAKLTAALEEQYPDIVYLDSQTYLDFVVKKGILSDGSAQKQLTNQELLQILEYYKIPEIKYVTLGVNFRYKNKLVAKDTFYQAYDMIIKTIQAPVEKMEVTIIATPGTSKDLNEWSAYTDAGYFDFYGVFLDACQDRRVEVYRKEQEIIGVLRVTDETVDYRNVWIFSSVGQTLSVYVDGIIRNFYVDEPMEVGKQMADIHMVEGTVARISLKTDVIRGKLLSVTDEYVEVEQYGKVPFDTNYKLYRTYGGFGELDKSKLLVGYDLQEFIVADGKVCGAVITQPFQINNIRVMIRTTGFESLFHNQVTVTCNQDFMVISGNEFQNVSIHPAGESVSFQKGDQRLKENRIRVIPVDFSQRIVVSSIERSQGKPAYPGYLEVGQSAEGLFLINEVNFEDYLKLVVPSEMPAGYGVEAAKVQAVCARSYAYNQLLNNDYAQYGAHIDDSTWYQVYNNTLEYAASSQAVEATCGQVMTKDGEVITAYYYSTSCGHGSDIAIWGQPSDSVSYIKAHTINPSNEVLDLTTNDAFLQYILQKNTGDFDAAFPLYRWKAYLSLEQINKFYGSTANVGKIKQMDVINRLNGGTVNELVLTGEKGTYHVTGELNIRKFLGNREINWTNNKNNKFSMASLPSGFFALQPVYKKNVLTGYNIIGGGFGHGLGMSQNGAYQMTKEGYLYEDILKFFYDGIVLEQIYK